MKEITNENFKDIIKSGVTLIDMYADWCGPCKALSPLLEELAPKYEGKAVFAKLNVDDAPEITEEYNVRGIPAVFIFKNGEVAKRIDGFDASRGEAVYAQAIEELL